VHRDLLEEPDLELHRFRRRLDDQVGIGDGRRELVLERQALLGAERRGRLELADLDPLVEVAVDRALSRAQLLGVDVIEIGGVAGERGDVGDPPPHRAGAEHGDLDDLRRRIDSALRLRHFGHSLLQSLAVRRIESTDQDAGIERMPVERSARV
jgi:hypothetical protein